MTEIMDTLAPYFFEVAYIVPDLDAAESFFTKTLGVSRQCGRGRPRPCARQLKFDARL